MDVGMWNAFRELFDSIDGNGQVSLSAYQSAKTYLERFETEINNWASEMESTM